MSERIPVPSLTWQNPSVNGQAVLLCLHGLGLHCGMFKAFGERAAKLGIICHALDIRGFGGWHKVHGGELDFPQCLADIKEKLSELQTKYPHLPVYVLGESLGGAIATRVAAEFPEHIDGAVIVSPARSIGDHKAAIGKVLLSLLTSPRQPINLSDVIARRAPRLVAAQNEPTVRLHFSLKELLHLTIFLRDAVKSAKRIQNTPVLMLQGHGDQLISTQSTIAFFEQLGAKDKELVVVGGADHLMIQHTEVHPHAMEVITRWLAQRTKARALRRAS